MAKIMQTFDCNITMPRDSGLNNKHRLHGMSIDVDVRACVCTQTPTPPPQTHRLHSQSNLIKHFAFISHSNPQSGAIICPLTETVIPVISNSLATGFYN